MERSLTCAKYKENQVFKKTIPKEFMLKKINIEEYPKFKKNLNSFFNDINKYFETSYDDKFIIIGNKHKHKNLIPFENAGKNRIKKWLNRITFKSLLKASNDSQKNLTIFQNKGKHEDKKKNIASSEENSLKPGQRFVDDKEIENIFNLYKELRKINKNKNSKFITLKDLNKSLNGSDFKSKKSSKILNNDNLINLKQYQTKKLYNSFVKKDNNSNNIFNETDGYKNISTLSGNLKDEISFKNNFVSIEVNNSNNNNIIVKQKEKEKQKLINKQKQYISKKLDKTIKNKFIHILALQEKTILDQNKFIKQQLNLRNYLSTKIKRKKNKLLMVQDENYRPALETKMKLNILQQKINPDKFYNWINDLHSSENSMITQKYLLSSETIRNPEIMKNFIQTKSKTLEKNDYVKKIIPRVTLRNLKNDLKNINRNYDSLYVKGKDLLKLESDVFKKLKGRKIMNDFERLMSPSNTKCKNIYSNIDRNLFNQKTKPNYLLTK